MFNFSKKQEPTQTKPIPTPELLAECDCRLTLKLEVIDEGDNLFLTFKKTKKVEKEQEILGPRNITNSYESDIIALLQYQTLNFTNISNPRSLPHQMMPSFIMNKLQLNCTKEILPIHDDLKKHFESLDGNKPFCFTKTYELVLKGKLFKVYEQEGPTEKLYESYTWYESPKEPKNVQTN